MQSFLNTIKELTGIDRAVTYTLTLRLFQIIAGLVTIVFIAYYLSPVHQGYFYTFSSILGLQVFFELGLTYVILQFSSHEKAHLEWSPRRTIEGNSAAKARLGSLMRLSIRWYGVAAFLFIIILVPVGLYFFGRNPNADTATNWQIPWILLVLPTAGILLLSPIFAILEGCGMISDVARYRTIQDIIAYIFFWSGLWLGGKLFAIPLLQSTRLIISLLWLFCFYRFFIKKIIRFKIDKIRLDWWSELWPMQWRMALSSMSGYFIFSMFIPILFAYCGAEEAGKMGMSLSVAGALNTLSMVWITTKIPTFGQLIALKKFNELDTIFQRAFKQAFLISVIGGICLLSCQLVLRMYHIPIAFRLLDPFSFGLLLGVSVINVIIFSEATYLRAHKEEPFLLNSVVGAILITLMCFLIGPSYGAIGMAAGYFILTATVSLIWATYIFFSKRNKWHSETIT